MTDDEKVVFRLPEPMKEWRVCVYRGTVKLWGAWIVPASSQRNALALVHHLFDSDFDRVTVERWR